MDFKQFFGILNLIVFIFSEKSNIFFYFSLILIFFLPYVDSHAYKAETWAQ